MSRKEGGKFGFAESIPNQKITAFKMDSAAVDTNSVEEQAEEIIANADPPSEVYLFSCIIQGRARLPIPCRALREARQPSEIPHSLGSLTVFRGNTIIILVLVVTAFR